MNDYALREDVFSYKSSRKSSEHSVKSASLRSSKQGQRNRRLLSIMNKNGRVEKSGTRLNNEESRPLASEEGTLGKVFS